MTTQSTTKTWVMLTRYHKDIHGEQYSYVYRVESPLIAQATINLWQEKYAKETDFKIFINLITLWRNDEIIDIHEMSEMELMRRANKEAFGVNRSALEPLPVIDPIPLPHICD